MKLVRYFFEPNYSVVNVCILIFGMTLAYAAHDGKMWIFLFFLALGNAVDLAAKAIIQAAKKSPRR